MKRILPIVSILLAVAAFSAVAGAQDKPSFVGTWKLAGEAADQFTPSTIVITQDGTNLVVVTSGQMGEFRTTYKLDGTAGPSSLDFQGNTIDRTTKMTWNEKKLTLTASSDMGGQAFEIKSVVSAAADGTMIVETTFPISRAAAGRSPPRRPTRSRSDGSPASSSRRRRARPSSRACRLSRTAPAAGRGGTFPPGSGAGIRGC
jgi:hypothetical protein